MIDKSAMSVLREIDDQIAVEFELEIDSLSMKRIKAAKHKLKQFEQWLSEQGAEVSAISDDDFLYFVRSLANDPVIFRSIQHHEIMGLLNPEYLSAWVEYADQARVIELYIHDLEQPMRFALLRVVLTAAEQAFNDTYGEGQHFRRVFGYLIEGDTDESAASTSE